MTNDIRVPAVDAFWAAFDQAWQDGGARSPEEACARLQETSNYSLAPATVRGWCRHTSLPRKNEDIEEMFLLLVGKARTQELMDKLRWARTKRSQKSPAQPPPPPLPEKVPWWHRRVRGGVQTWHLVVASVLLLGLVTAITVANVADDQSSASGAPSTSTTARGGAPEPRVDAESCPSEVVRAASKTKRAHAEFCPDRKQFLLYDDKSDDKSAILAVRRNGEEVPAYFNSNGFERRKSDGTIYRVPPQSVPFQGNVRDHAEFRVCFGDKNPARSYNEDTCGDLSPFWPPG